MLAVTVRIQSPKPSKRIFLAVLSHWQVSVLLVILKESGAGEITGLSKASLEIPRMPELGKLGQVMDREVAPPEGATTATSITTTTRG